MIVDKVLVLVSYLKLSILNKWSKHLSILGQAVLRIVTKCNKQYIVANSCIAIYRNMLMAYR